MTEARWEIVDAHRCTACGHLDTDGYRMVDHLRTHEQPTRVSAELRAVSSRPHPTPETADPPPAVPEETDHA